VYVTVPIAGNRGVGADDCSAHRQPFPANPPGSGAASHANGEPQLEMKLDIEMLTELKAAVRIGASSLQLA
jgi:hypothetical protein